ncbi:MAG: hypothetical protein R3F61_03200 [Myxococcota bacterium]
MHPDLVRLIAANRYDGELLDLKKQKRKLDEALEAARTGAEAASATLAELTAEQEANRTRQRELQRSIETYEARRKSANRVLESGGGDPEAAERQIQGCTEQLDLLETDLLETMERADTLVEALATAKASVATTSDTLAGLEAAHGPAVDALRARFDATVPLRDAELDALDVQTRGKYIVLRDRKGFAVASIEKGACHACRMVIQQQHLADLKRGLILPCRGCGRWLAPDEAG